MDDTTFWKTIVPLFTNKPPSVSNIRNKNFESIFSFKKTTPEELIRVIWNLNIRKNCQTLDIPTKVIKFNSEISLYTNTSTTVMIEVNFRMN